MTNQILSHSAITTNKFTKLGAHGKTRNLKIPIEIKQARKELKAAHNAYKIAIKNKMANIKTVSSILANKKQKLRSVTRRVHHQGDMRRDTKLFSVYNSSLACSLFKAMRSFKSSSTGEVPFLTVGDVQYPED